jgi:RNA polymerase sigma-70 factor (ECF subfamily)
LYKHQGIGLHPMKQEPSDQHLSRISTLWTIVANAKGGPAEAASAAQQELMRRYSRAVYRYLLGALRDSDAADELAQEFALRFLRGDCRRADPARGRFRDFVKGILAHLIADYYRRRRALPQPLPPDGGETAAAVLHQSAELDRDFLESWRNELLARAWDALDRMEKETGKPFHTVLRFRIQHPDLRSPQMAEQLSVSLGQRVTSDWVRQMLHRGRDKFADFLLTEVADTLQSPGAQELEEELSDIGLLSYCQPALQRFRRQNG